MPSTKRVTLQPETRDLIDQLSPTETPPLLVAGAVALCIPRISGMLHGNARRFRKDSPEYAPHQHMLQVIEGFVTGLGSQGAETPGKDDHERLHVDPELIYNVGALMLVLGVRYHCASLLNTSQALKRDVMFEVETAFDAWLAANGANYFVNDAWVMHEITVQTLFDTIEPTDEIAQLFWKKVVQPLNLPKGPNWLRSAFELLTPDNFAAAFNNPANMS